jgi:hypothetical protein
LVLASREKIPGVDLDVGKPILATIKDEQTFVARPGGLTALLCRAPGGSDYSLLVLLQVSPQDASAQSAGQKLFPSSQPSVSPDSSVQSAAPRSSRALDTTAITESTEIGRQIAAPTADRPGYVVIHTNGQHDFGRVSAVEKAPSPETLDQQMEKSLAQQHYLRADAKHQPAYLIVFSWGCDRALVYNSQDAGFANLLDRAALVGGNRFANELRTALDREVSALDATSNDAFGAQMPGMRPVSAADLFLSISPLAHFRTRNQKTEDLMNQIANDCYYLIISAFDYAAVGEGKSRLLWRTKLTTTAPGTSLTKAIPALIASGSEYLGRSMDDAELFTCRDR